MPSGGAFAINSLGEVAGDITTSSGGHAAVSNPGVNPGLVLPVAKALGCAMSLPEPREPSSQAAR
jgi:hypothetical protein